MKSIYYTFFFWCFNSTKKSFLIIRKGKNISRWFCKFLFRQRIEKLQFWIIETSWAYDHIWHGKEIRCNFRKVPVANLLFSLLNSLIEIDNWQFQDHQTSEKDFFSQNDQSIVKKNWMQANSLKWFWLENLKNRSIILWC